MKNRVFVEQSIFWLGGGRNHSNLLHHEVIHRPLLYLGECIASEHGETTFVRFDHLFTTFIAHRHSQRWILKATRSAMKEHSLWRMHCKWTRWDDFCALRSLIHHLHCTQTLTTLNLQSNNDRRWRSTVFGECIASEHGETTFVRFDHLFTTFIAHRHSQRWILVATTSARKEHSLWRMHCKWTRWDDFCALRSLIHHLHCTQTLTTLNLRATRSAMKGAQSLANALQVNTVRRLLCASITYSPPSLHTDTHNAGSSIQQHRPWRSTVFGECIASEHGETTFVRFDHLFTTFIAHRHSQRCIFTSNNIGAEGAQSLANALQVNTVRRLLRASITYSPPSLHTDTHNAGSSRQHDRRGRSTVFGECIASEHGETTFVRFDHLFTTFIAHRHSQRWIFNTTTSAHEGAQSLANALQVNTVRRFCALRSLIHHLHCTQTLTTLNLSWQQDRRGRSTVFGECIASEHGETTFVRFDHLFITFIAHRHSQRWILKATTSAMKEHSLWRMHCKWTRWDDFCALRSLIHHLHCTQTLTTLNLSTTEQRHRRWRSTVFGECIASEHGETTLVRFDHLFTTFIAHRHSQRWILVGTRSAMKEHSLWRMHCKWTRWDDFCALRSLIHHLHCTQTLTTLDLEWQQHRRWRSTVFGECIASEHGETTFVRFDHLFTTFIAHRHSQRWIFKDNNIGAEGAQSLANASPSIRGKN